MYKSSLSTIIGEDTRFATISPSENVHVAAKRMEELKLKCLIVALGNKIQGRLMCYCVQGILTLNDITLRVVVQNLSPHLTTVDKVMTPNYQYASIDTRILEALHMMHYGRLLHLLVMKKDGSIVACVNYSQLSLAAIYLSLVNSNDESSLFTFKFVDRVGRMHQYNSGTDSLNGLISFVIERTGDHHPNPLLWYENDDGDKIVLSKDEDLIDAVRHARIKGLNVLRIHLKYDDNDIISPKTEIGESSTRHALGESKSTSIAAAIRHASRDYGVLATALTSIGIGLVLLYRGSSALGTRISRGTQTRTEPETRTEPSPKWTENFWFINDVKKFVEEGF